MVSLNWRSPHVSALQGWDAGAQQVADVAQGRCMWAETPALLQKPVLHAQLCPAAHVHSSNCESTATCPAQQPTIVAAHKGPAGCAVHWLCLVFSAQHSHNRVASGRMLSAIAGANHYRAPSQRGIGKESVDREGAAASSAEMSVAAAAG